MGIRSTDIKLAPGTAMTVWLDGRPYELVTTPLDVDSMAAWRARCVAEGLEPVDVAFLNKENWPPIVVYDKRTR